jgi:hypothetical protein
MRRPVAGLSSVSSSGIGFISLTLSASASSPLPILTKGTPPRVVPLGARRQASQTGAAGGGQGRSARQQPESLWTQNEIPENGAPLSPLPDRAGGVHPVGQILSPVAVTPWALRSNPMTPTAGRADGGSMASMPIHYVVAGRPLSGGLSPASLPAQSHRLLPAGSATSGQKPDLRLCLVRRRATKASCVSN